MYSFPIQTGVSGVRGKKPSQRTYLSDILYLYDIESMWVYTHTAKWVVKKTKGG